MSRLTEDLLTLARVESREQRFDIQPVAAAELLQEAVQNFRELARTHGIDLQVEDSAPDLVNADREAIHQVFSMAWNRSLCKSSRNVITHCIDIWRHKAR